MMRLTGRISAIDRRETLRYLGCPPGAPADDGTEELIEECGRELLAAQSLSAVYALFGVTRRGGSLDLGFVRTDSRDLARYLSGCGRAAVFAATIGAGADRLAARYARTSPARAAVIQALGAALAEQWCNEVHARLSAQYGALSARFSCGFGDLPLAFQRDVFAALDVTKNIGVTLTEDCFMLPSKSVTAIVGIR